MLLGCGGGGGGGDNNSATNSQGFRMDSEGLRIIHGSIDLAPLNLVTTTSPELPDTVVQRANFGAASGYRKIEAANQLFKIQRKDTPSRTYFSIPVTEAGARKRSILVYGNKQSFGFNYSVLEDDTASPESGNSKVRIVHAVNGSNKISLSSDRLSVDSLSFGQASAYAEVLAGSFTFGIRRTADGAVISSRSITLEPNKVYTIVALGEVDYFTTSTVIEDLS